jgi:glycine/D-amino acid oxidase-like deaminating enzyme
MTAPDVAVIGAGIAGCSAAYFLAGRGARVVVFERDDIAAAASGRNSGVLQHPLVPALGALHDETLECYRLCGVEVDETRVGLLILTSDPTELRPLAAKLGGLAPGVSVEPVDAEALPALEPAVAPGLAGCLLGTGRAVEPASATRTVAQRAAEAGARFRTGTRAAPLVRNGRAVGVRTGDSETIDAGAVLVAAGPWSNELVDPAGGWQPIRSLWGTTAQVTLSQPPRLPLEEATVAGLAGGQHVVESVFSLVSTREASVLGSSFTASRLEDASSVAALARRGSRFVPALASVPVRRIRSCARPVSYDGLPLVGPVASVAGLHVVSGHGAWGLSVGPATARIAVDAILDDAAVPAHFAASRVQAGGARRTASSHEPRRQ